MNFLQCFILGILITTVYLIYPSLDVNPSIEYDPGFCLSFDDDSFQAWQHLRPLLDKYNIKVTFFVTLQPDLTPKTQQTLKILSTDGHEIGIHGKSHLDPIEKLRHTPVINYIKDEYFYVRYEIEKLNIPVFSAAYVEGIRNKMMDREMKKYFRNIRSVSESQRHQPVTDLSIIDEIFFHQSDQVLQPLCIDEIQNIQLEDIISLLNRVKEEQKIIMFYAHNPVETPSENQWEISFKILEYIFRTCHSLGLRSYLVKDLPDA
ncbi:MAG: polysaccharide deacetylase family protein [Fidelibacterota bacterium]